MRRTIGLVLGALLLAVASGLVYAGWRAQQAPLASGEGYVCPLTGVELPCPACCPLTGQGKAACCGEQAASAASRPEATSDQQPSTASAGRCYRLKIQGMTCEGCAATVQKALAQVPGVADAKVHLAKAEAEVCVQDGAKVAGDVLVRAVEKAGSNTGHRYRATLIAQPR